MLVDARSVRTGSVIVGDVCVIGAGAAGITVSRALAAKGREVVLLESGGFEPDAATQALYRGKAVGLPIDPTEHFGLDVPRLRYFGGTTNHWAGFCRPFPELDFETRSYVPRSGWPIDRSDLDLYYRAAHDVIQLGPYDYSVDSWVQRGGLVAPFLDDPATTPHSVVQIAGRPVLGETYRKEIVAHRNIRLVLWANVTRIGLGADSDAVEHVNVKTLGGNSFTVRARVFVLATGGLEGPRLLLASNDRRPAGIGNEHDQVGRSFMEHVNIAVGPVPLTVDAAALAPYELNKTSMQVRGELHEFSLQTVMLIAPDVMQRYELRACELTLEYPFAPDDSRLRKLFPGVRAGLDLLRAEGTPARTVPIARVLCEQEPNPASRVTLVRDTDALGMPRIELDWRLTRDDRASLLRSLRFFATQLGARGLGRFQLDIGGFRNIEAAADDDLDFTVNTGSHHTGTARMSNTPEQGVVDPDLKVHSVANLYVAGSAVYPTSGANPPTLTIVALSLRLADHLDAKL